MFKRSAAATVAVFVAGIGFSSAQADPLVIRADWNITPGQFAPLIPGVMQYAPNVFRH